MDKGIPVEHADIARPKAPSIGDEATHHHAVNAQQILQRMRIEFRNKVVGGACIFDFEDVAPVSENPLPSIIALTARSSSLFPSMTSEE